jgi:hypothetical protein
MPRLVQKVKRSRESSGFHIKSACKSDAAQLYCNKKEVADFQLGFVDECQIRGGQEVSADLFDFAAHPVTRVSQVFSALLPFVEAEPGSAFRCIYDVPLAEAQPGWSERRAVVS